jgi:tripartite-type tricarboxylate transporter receptor subunit TctC
MQTSRILAVVAASFALLAQAQYPNKPIEMILPIAPGGGLDIQARLLAELAEAELRQRIVIVNKPGAGGTIGVSLVTQAKPDGYTLGAVWSGPLTASPHNQPVPYTLADYVPLVQFSKAPFVVCVAPDFPADTGAQLIAHLKQNPDKYSYGNEGAGGTLDLGLARIFAALGVSQLPVPFAGAADTARNFAGGHITMYAGGIASILPLAKAGKAKCLMMTSAARNPLFPAAAGLDDLGVGRAETVFWRAIIAPKGLPDDVRRTLETAFTNAAKSAKFTEFLAGLGEVPASLSGAALADYTSAEFNALGALAKSAAKPKQ